MIFDLFVSTLISIFLATILISLIDSEIKAKKLIEIAVFRKSQYDRVSKHCSDIKVNAKSKLLCSTNLFWLKNNNWINVCLDLSMAKTKPTRWFMIITTCDFFKKSYSNSLSLNFYNSNYDLIVMQWLAKS